MTTRFCAALLIAFVWSNSLMADCGWVRWMRTTVISEEDKAGKSLTPDTAAKWEPDNAFEQLADCRQSVTGSIDGFAKSAEKAKASVDPVIIRSIAVNDTSVLMTVRTANGSTRSFKLVLTCFPSSVDPRAR